MVGVAKSDFGVGARARLVTDLERADARHVGLPGENHEIGHQFIVLGPGRRGTRGADHLWQNVVLALRLRALDAPLNVTHRVQVLVDLAAVRCAKLYAQPLGVLVDGIKDAAVLLPQARTRLRIGRGAEPTLEQRTGTALPRQRR